MKPETRVERELLQCWTLFLLSLKAPVLHLSWSCTSTNSSKARTLTVTMFSSKGTAVLQDAGPGYPAHAQRGSFQATRWAGPWAVMVRDGGAPGTRSFPKYGLFSY